MPPSGSVRGPLFRGDTVRLSACFVALVFSAAAHAAPPQKLYLWPEGAPGARANGGDEVVTIKGQGDHVVSNVRIEKVAKNGDVHARSRFHMMELRRDDVRHFAGSYTHHLKKTKNGYRIQLQRVDMTNAQAAYDYVLQVWV